MKYLIFIILLFPFFSFGQQDSIVYKQEYVKSADKQDSTLYWVKYTYSKESTKGNTKYELYTTADSIGTITLEKSIKNIIIDDSRQYNKAKADWEELEKNYQIKISQGIKQYRDIFKTKPALDSLSNTSALLGTWMFNNEMIIITKALKIKTNLIDFISDQQFTVVIADNKETFFLRENMWVSENYKLKKVKSIK